MKKTGGRSNDQHPGREAAGIRSCRHPPRLKVGGQPLTDRIEALTPETTERAGHEQRTDRSHRRASQRHANCHRAFIERDLHTHGGYPRRPGNIVRRNRRSHPCRSAESRVDTDFLASSRRRDSELRGRCRMGATGFQADPLSARCNWSDVSPNHEAGRDVTNNGGRRISGHLPLRVRRTRCGAFHLASAEVYSIQPLSKDIRQ